MGSKNWWSSLISFLKGLFRKQPAHGSQRGGVTGELTADYETPAPLSYSIQGTELRVGVVSTRGNVRRHNEDNFYVPGKPTLQNGPVEGGGSTHGTDEYPSSLISEGPKDLFIVADGMGGQLAGERASQMAVERIPLEVALRDREHQGQADEATYKRVVLDAVTKVNDEILNESNQKGEYQNMGTTVSLVLFRMGHVFVLGIGDSRVYLLRQGTLKQLTRDHSLAHALEEAGTISPTEVENHRFKNILYLYLGSKDVNERPEDVKVLGYGPGDQFLLATDGLTGVVKEQEIVEIMNSSDDPQRVAQLLVNRALENQSKDNVTCIVIRVT